MFESIGSLSTTILIYLTSLHLSKSRYPLSPLITAPLVTVGVITLLHVPTAQYLHHVSLLTGLLGPATVALAVPLYRQIATLRPMLWSLVTAVSLGTATAMSVTVAILSVFDTPRALELSLLPKTATTPVVLGIIPLIGGIPALAAAASVIGGLLGSLIGIPLLRMTRVTSPIAQAVAMGTIASGIGTARMLRHSPQQGALSSFAMATAAVVVTIMSVAWVKYFL